MTQPGTMVGRYELLSLLGQGGQAAVYLAYDPNLDRQVAVKILPREYLGDQDSRERFTGEARLVATLQHPNIVPVFDFGEQDGQPYIVMRAMNGGSLADRIKAGSLSFSDTARIVREIAVALDFAHAAGVIHRDVKPANVLFDDLGTALLVDFGIARLAEVGVTRTSGAIAGTPAYMAPEQAQGQTAGPAADLYALGTVAYEMVTGHTPFHGNNPWAVISQRLHDDVPPPTERNPAIPPAGGDAILRALHREPWGRQRSATTFAEELALGLGLTERFITPLSLELSAPRYRLLFGSRFGAARHDLTIINNSRETTAIDLSANPRTGPCFIKMQAHATAPPESAITVPVSVSPRRRRWRGGDLTHRFTIRAEAAGHPPAELGASHLDRPYGWLPFAAIGGLLAVAVAGSLPFVLRDTSSPAEPRAGVAFVSERDGNQEIYLDPLDSGDPENLTRTPGINEDQPDWSPDGSRIAFVSDREGGRAIWVMDPDGGNSRRLTEPDGNDQHPRWSPDGRFIAFDSTRDGRTNPDVFVMGADGSDPVPLTADGASDAYPDWSPDGERLVFASNRGGNAELYVVEADGSGLQQLTESAGTDFAPAWSPDGSFIAFESDRDGEFSVYIVPVGGLREGDIPEAHRIGGGFGGQPTWDPSGERLAFLGEVGGEPAVFVVTIDDNGRPGEPAALGDQTDGFAPAWSPFVPDASDD